MGLPIEARLCAGEVVALVGGGNSAGQAVAYLALQVRHLQLVVRGQVLEALMSRYLIERITALPNVTLHARKEVVALEGEANEGLRAARFRYTGEEITAPLRHLFLFIGADPNTGWLDGCGVALDDKGSCAPRPRTRVRRAASGPGLSASRFTWRRVCRACSRSATRAGSTKRVAAAVGEGAAVVASIHALLAG